MLIIICLFPLLCLDTLTIFPSNSCQDLFQHFLYMIYPQALWRFDYTWQVQYTYLIKVMLSTCLEIALSVTFEWLSKFQACFIKTLYNFQQTINQFTFYHFTKTYYAHFQVFVYNRFWHSICTIYKWRAHYFFVVLFHMCNELSKSCEANHVITCHVYSMSLFSSRFHLNKRGYKSHSR